MTQQNDEQDNTDVGDEDKESLRPTTADYDSVPFSNNEEGITFDAVQADLEHD